jgi:hypothetical protein
MDERRRVSYSFLRGVALRHELLTSRLVTAELSETRDWAQKRAVYRRLWGLRLRMITLIGRIGWISREIRTAGGWGANRIADVTHIAYAVFAGADALVTWDVDDLARERTRQVVQAYGRREGRSVPLIGTPAEVAEWLGLRIR